VIDSTRTIAEIRTDLEAGLRELVAARP